MWRASSEAMFDDSKTSNQRNLSMMRLLIKFCLKGWKGVGEPFVLVRGEMAEEQHDLLCTNINLTLAIGGIIAKELEWNDTDKKK